MRMGRASKKIPGISSTEMISSSTPTVAVMKPIRILMMVFFFRYTVNIYIYSELAANKPNILTMRSRRNAIFICLPLLGVCMMQALGKCMLYRSLEVLKVIHNNITIMLYHIIALDSRCDDSYAKAYT